MILEYSGKSNDCDWENGGGCPFEYDCFVCSLAEELDKENIYLHEDDFKCPAKSIKIEIELNAS